jgi:hypothetical protein
MIVQVFDRVDRDTKLLGLSDDHQENIVNSVRTSLQFLMSNRHIAGSLDVVQGRRQMHTQNIVRVIY